MVDEKMDKKIDAKIVAVGIDKLVKINAKLPKNLIKFLQT